MLVSVTPEHQEVGVVALLGGVLLCHCVAVLLGVGGLEKHRGSRGRAFTISGEDRKGNIG